MNSSIALFVGLSIVVSFALGWLLQAHVARAAAASLHAELIRLRTMEAIAAEYQSQNDQNHAQLADAIEEVRFANAEVARLKTAVEVAHTQLRQQRTFSAQRFELIEKQHGEFARRFEAESAKMFVDNSQRMADAAEAQLGNFLQPFREQLVDFKKRVEDTYDKDSQDRHVLKAEISQLKQLNERISQDAINLTNALRGDNKAQGNWGELVLERVLESAGLNIGREYDREVSFTSESGKRLRPDVLIHLPGGRDIIVDSKVSVKEYEKALAQSDHAQRDKWMLAHSKALRRHVESLSIKKYESIEAIDSLDFVLLFVPVEGAFQAALEADSSLYKDAFDRDVVLVGPASLMVTCRTIQNVWRSEIQCRNSAKIARKAGEMIDKFNSFAEELDAVGRALATANDSYEFARRKLNSGRGNLVSRASALQQLGATGKKPVVC